MLHKTVSVEMDGPFELTNSNIDIHIRGKSPGNFALGYVDDHNFYVEYVGRSDEDINTCLKDWVGIYKVFKWSYARSVGEAYEKECKNYHEFGENQFLDNKQHPSKPIKINCKCKICGK